MSRLKAQSHIYPSIDISYSPSKPLLAPVILNLPANGFRLRFDGPDQRLRLIEVLDFSKIQLTYEGKDVVKLPELDESSFKNCPTPGPVFRHVYDRMIGPTFPGEYIPPATGSKEKGGLYVLSYPGIAFNFSLQDSAWTQNSDFVSLLSSSAASPAVSMAIFDGASWPEVRQDLFKKHCANPRSLALSSRGREFCPDEVDLVEVRNNGKLDLIRRFGSPFQLVLGETTPQDLLAELGPPDVIYRKSDRRLSIHKPQHKDLDFDQTRRVVSPPRYDDPNDADQSSSQNTTDESDAQDEGQISSQSSGDAPTECFYNYFQHGFDVFVSYTTASPKRLPISEIEEANLEDPTDSDHLVATKVLLHGNVPGSYPFNRYRRCRWLLESEDVALNSETPFKLLSERLRKIWDNNPASEGKPSSLEQGMVLNRGWGNSPGSSVELLGGWEESAKTNDPAGVDGPGLGNTKLFGFPGLVFEVLKNDMVSCLTVY